MPIADISDWQHRAAPERQWLLDKLIPLGQTTYLTGPGAAGKSLLGQQLATHAAIGRDFLGAAIRKTPAIYLTCEDDENELHRRQEAICAALRISMSDLAGQLHLVSLSGQIGAELAIFDPRAVADEFGRGGELIQPTSRYNALQGVAMAAEAGLVALDNVAHLFAGNENIRVEVAAFIALLNRLAMRTRGSVLLIGHPNKAGDSFSGSTAWENQVRSRLFLEVPKDADGMIADPDRRVLRNEKANYSRHGAELSFRWHNWAYVRDEDLPEGIAHRLAATAQASTDNALFLACLAERNRQLRPVSEHPSANYAPTQFAKMPESKRIGKTRLEAAMDRLFKIGQIKRDFVCRDTIRRRDLHGLIEAPESASNAASNGAQTGATNCVKPEAQTATNTHPIPKGIRGAAHGSVAPHTGEAA